ncbi:MAG: addiction module protein [Lysobacterales bacterium]
MAKRIDDIRRDIASLGSREKASLALSLLQDLDREADFRVDELWAEEAQLRWAAYKAGDIETSPLHEAVKRAKSELSG